jgi:hypothetical protein
VGGGWTALLGLVPELASTLATPAYLAAIAWRFARRAARVASTGGGEVGKSNSMSGWGAGWGAVEGGCGGCGETRVEVIGEGPRLWRGDILVKATDQYWCQM